MPNDTQKPFISFCPEWKDAQVFREWQQYAKKIYKSGMMLYYSDSLSDTYMYQAMLRLFRKKIPLSRRETLVQFV